MGSNFCGAQQVNPELIYRSDYVHGGDFAMGSPLQAIFLIHSIYVGSNFCGAQQVKSYLSAIVVPIFINYLEPWTKSDGYGRV